MPRSQTESAPLATRKLLKKSAEHGRKSEELSRSELPEHRELETIYQSLKVEDKKKLAQTALDKALEKQPTLTGELADLNLQDIPELPGFRGKLSDVEQEDHPQFFKKHVERDEYLIVVRLNNGEPNSLLMFNAEEKRGGKFSKKLQDSKLFHLGSEEEFDKNRRKPLSRTYWTGEGMWMKGARTAEKYKRNFKGHTELKLETYHKKKDEQKVKGFRSEKRKDQRRKSEQNLEAFKEENFSDQMVEMWTQEDASRTIREKRKEKALLVVNATGELFAKELRNTTYLAKDVAETVARKGAEKGKSMLKSLFSGGTEIIKKYTTEDEDGNKSIDLNGVLLEINQWIRI